MKKKCTVLSLCSFAIALAIFLFAYFLYHYASPHGGFTAVFQDTPAKPMITWLFAIWGVHFLFAGVMSLLIGHIFFRNQ